MLIVFLLVGLLPFTILGYLATDNAGNALDKQIVAQLESLRSARQQQALSFMVELKTDMDILGRVISKTRDQAFLTLSAANDLKVQQLTRFFTRYTNILEDLPYNKRFSEGLEAFSTVFERGLNSPEYKAIVNERESGFKSFQKSFEFYDIFLINATGDIVYTLLKESDLG
ncbi:hypothetical protein TI04_03485, partial [Achromatium sp. WMS2]